MMMREDGEFKQLSRARQMLVHRVIQKGQEAAQTILNTQTRVDETVMRTRSADWFAKLVERLTAARVATTQGHASTGILLENGTGTVD